MCILHLATQASRKNGMLLMLTWTLITNLRYVPTLQFIQGMDPLFNQYCWTLHFTWRTVCSAGIPSLARLVVLLLFYPLECISNHSVLTHSYVIWTASQVVAFCKEKGVGLVVIGPEVPLVAGLADDLEAAGVPTWGPTAKAAQLEGSKAFMKVSVLLEGWDSSSS
jgi:hypothetical protein